MGDRTITSKDSESVSGKSAQAMNIMAAKLVADTVKSTLGPRGMDKMLVDSAGNVVVTNDGATILREMDIEHPTAKMIVETAKTQEAEVGDGTTSVVVFAGELLKNAEELLEKGVHPTVIVSGYKKAAHTAISYLRKQATPAASLRDVLEPVLIGKGAEDAKEHLLSLLDTIGSRLRKEKVHDRSFVAVEKKVGGSVQDTRLVSGVVIDREIVHPDMPRSLTKAKVLLINAPLEVTALQHDTKISVSDPKQFEAFIALEERLVQDLVKRIVASGATAVFCQKGIDESVQHLLAKHGVLALRRMKKSDMRRLAKTTGAKIVSSVSSFAAEDLGAASSIAEECIEQDEYVVLVKGTGPISTLLVRGASSHVVDEVARALDDTLGVLFTLLENDAVVPGAGAIEMELAKQVDVFAASLRGKEQLAVHAFAKSLTVIPHVLAENAGLDAIEIVASLKAMHQEGVTTAGVNVLSGIVERDAFVVELVKVKQQFISAATEVATMILRIDDIILAKKVTLGTSEPVLD
ncbi:MAG: thermosome subunit [Candidatus Woesearchaeota archaeon]|nr:MAG: thermosome subunit [Candidatus Woesearchaeota archaeon]